MVRRKENVGLQAHSTIAHSYEANKSDYYKVVVDHATGLMWQQVGSNGSMALEKAKEWVKDLNSRGYAGYHDWRLPTVEEAATLLEFSKNYNNLYIAPVFNRKQKYIWTGDKRSGMDATWYVSFVSGGIYWGYNYYDYYVRPVRSISNQQSQNIKKEVVLRNSPFPVFSNKDSNIFHKKDCSKLEATEDLVRFDSPQEASKAGGLPCNYCNP